MALLLPELLADKTMGFPESSYGANQVTLILADGRHIHAVFLACRREIVKIGSRIVSQSDELGSQLADIIDVISEVR